MQSLDEKIINDDLSEVKGEDTLVNGFSSMTIEKVIDKAKTYLHKEKNLQLIIDAYNLAANQHAGQFRKSGEPYIQHPLEIAYMLADLNCGPATIAAGLLHDVVEDTGYDLEKIRAYFGNDVANIVDGVTKIGKLKYMTKEKALAKDHQKILIAMAKDIRVVLVKLVDRVHNMRTLQFQPPEKQIRISKETLDLYAPLAHRLGMYRIKSELEDLSLKYLKPDEYNRVLNYIEEKKNTKINSFDAMKEKITKILIDNNITHFDIKSRVKNTYSLWKKMEDKGKSFDQVYDLFALRIIVDNVEQCYRILGLMHSEWAPLPKRIKDYIATPKPNMYQSLHTTVVGEEGNIFEIQIRTFEMDTIAELGVAAHWSYKESNKNYTPEKEQEELANKLKWYRDLLSYAEMGEKDDNDPLNDIKNELFNANIYVFTPRGDVIDMPKIATPLDFAYRIHTEVGNHTVGATVNGKIVPLTYRLQTGDVCDIRTNKSFNGPTDAWLKIVQTSHAKHKIIAILNKRKRDEKVASGMNEFDQMLKSNNIETKLTDKMVKDNFDKYNIKTLEEFYYEIGMGNLSVKGAYNKLFTTEVVGDEALIKQYNESEIRQKHHSNNAYGVVVDGLDKAQIKLASCCHPVLGDAIMGYVSKGFGIVVHRYECPNCSSFERERFINVYWDKDQATKYFETIIEVLSFDRHNILTEIINALNSSLISIQSINNTKTKTGELLTKIKLNVKDAETLDVAFANLKKISDVYEVERVIK